MLLSRPLTNTLEKGKLREVVVVVVVVDVVVVVVVVDDDVGDDDVYKKTMLTSLNQIYY
jgi:hypothetical protein